MSNLGIVVVPVGKIVLHCLELDLRMKEWSLKLTRVTGTECDSVTGKHVTMLESKILRKLSDPFLLPFTDSLYIQTTAIGAKVCEFVCHIHKYFLAFRIVYVFLYT